MYKKTIFAIMPAKFLKNTILGILLVAFLAIKGIGLHSFLHDDNNPQQECEWCIIATTDQTKPLINDSSATIEIIYFEFEQTPKVQNLYAGIFIPKSLSGKYYNKPPPFLS